MTETAVEETTTADPTPSPIEAAAAAIAEGDHLLDKLAEGYVTIGSGDMEAEVIRQLVESVQFFANSMGSTLASITRFVSAVEEECGV